MNKQTLLRLKEIVNALSVQALEIDQHNKQNKAFSFRKDSNVFSEALFSTHSEFLTPYVNETLSKINELEILLQQNKRQFGLQRLQHLEQQVSALINAIKANSTLNKSSEQQLQASKERRYKQAAQRMMASSQALHQKLAETFEFERRLQVMLNDKERELGSSTEQHRQAITQQILVLHQRLGRCRQAISKLERQIEMSEKR
ncbi:primosomal protein N' [Thalassotalea insulae]|uniref:Primosomal protein N n=1 Tax=Thalassotalea insulae TaxID=2056778 RepID=A0ABQ6GN15_9GAMM|nr:primosomal replication protein PriC [Thalassotalea insulae]GLX77383.1 primosomal protein N' [Thalassotalea insulae]